MHLGLDRGAQLLSQSRAVSSSFCIMGQPLWAAVLAMPQVWATFQMSLSSSASDLCLVPPICLMGRSELRMVRMVLPKDSIQKWCIFDLSGQES